MMIEPATYLAALVADVHRAGGTFVVRRFADANEIMAVPEPAVVNHTGLGTAALFGDPELVPLKGQLTVLLPQPEVDYATLAGDLYMFARTAHSPRRHARARGRYARTEPRGEARDPRGARALLRGRRGARWHLTGSFPFGRPARRGTALPAHARPGARGRVRASGARDGHRAPATGIGLRRRACGSGDGRPAARGGCGLASPSGLARGGMARRRMVSSCLMLA
jgi:hypothetical protein